MRNTQYVVKCVTHSARIRFSGPLPFYLSLFPLATNKHCVAPFIRINPDLAFASGSNLSKRATRAEIIVVWKLDFDVTCITQKSKRMYAKDIKRMSECSECPFVFCIYLRFYGKVRRKETRNVHRNLAIISSPKSEARK